MWDIFFADYPHCLDCSDSIDGLSQSQLFFPLKISRLKQWLATLTNSSLSSITRKKYTPIERTLTKGEYGARPTIMKFFCSSDHMKCGEQVKVYWAIHNADEVSITISQGSYSTTEIMPADGEITLTSNISAEDITITITAKNNSGDSSSRKTISLSKRENTVQTNIGATVVYTVVYVVIIILVVIEILSRFL